MSKEKRFPKLFWVVIMFEFFERGSYYGMMSVLSIYFTDVLMFEKEAVGIIKSTIQPLLYFLPIITGALADRFGYRRTLMVAFSFLGLGYFFTAQATDYGLIFLALVVMGIGAGTFKPVISGSIARMTDESNSAVAFGIFYWTINLGAFLFPLLLVPFLRDNIGWQWVFYASALGTGSMLIPTIFSFKEPPLPEGTEKKETNLQDTIAHSFEIIYSPIVLVHNAFKTKKPIAPILFLIVALALLGRGGLMYMEGNRLNLSMSTVPVETAEGTRYLTIDRNMTVEEAFKADESGVTVFQPEAENLLNRLAEKFPAVSAESLGEAMKVAGGPVMLNFMRSDGTGLAINAAGDRAFDIQVGSGVDPDQALDQLKQNKLIVPFSDSKLKQFLRDARYRPFPMLFAGLLLLTALLILFIKREDSGKMLSLMFLVGIGAVCFLLPDLTLFSRILSFAIFITVLSLFTIDTGDTPMFRDHFKFLLLIFIYSGFWVLYFQMFDSVLWYVQAYVNTTPLNNIVNAIPALFGMETSWRFNVEHVTVLNALTIIALQLFVTKFVKDKDALKTMIGGILLGTIGMAILAISTGIWVFLAGIIIFSIGEMSAHPKFISYVGQTAPKSKVAMYMGYLFLYGVIGSSIGGVLGANLYVHFVDHLQQPRLLWLVFSMIGVVTIMGIMIYNKVFSPTKKPAE